MIEALSEVGLQVTDLPGVRLRLRAIRDDLAAGRSCLWLLPSKAVGGPGSEADVLLKSLLHDLQGFVELPGARTAGLPSVPVPMEVPHPADVPLLDVDDGLSDLFDGPALPRIEETTRPATAAEELDELCERLAKDLLPHAWRDSTDEDVMEGWSAADEVLARMTAGARDDLGWEIVVIKGWEEPSPEAPARFLQRLAAAVKFHGLYDAPPRALLACSPDDVPRRVLDELPRQGVAVHWWWGVTGRLDTSTVVAMARPAPVHGSPRARLVESALQATVSEVAGPHLAVAASLAREWNGSPDTLARTVHEVAGAPASVPRAVRRRVAGHPGERPRRDLQRQWSRGEVDSWDGHLRLHPSCGVSRDDVDKQMWLAQNRVLLPLIDAARERLLSVFTERAVMPPERLAAKYGGPDAPTGGYSLEGLELGPMRAAAGAGDVLLRREEREVLFRLWRARNLLAHRRPLTGADFDKTIEAVCG